MRMMVRSRIRGVRSRGDRTMQPRTWIAGLILTLLLVPVAALGQEEGPKKQEFQGAEKRLNDFEKKVERMRGQPFKLGYIEKEALKRIWAPKEKFPGNPDVEGLYQRAKKALLASKGETMQITPAMLAYRENEQKLKAMFFEVAGKEWAALKKKVETTEGSILQAYPPPDHREVDAEDLVGKYVILDNFEYPMNEFSDLGRQLVFCGSGARGYYYVELSNRSWLGAYEAFKRYRRFINRDVPENKPWTIVGKIIGLELIVPQAGKEKTANAHWGWSVEPVAIYVEGCTLSTANAELELGGSFAGEETMENIKSSMYTVREIPDDVTPERLTEIYIAAIKKKNWPLFLECIDPARRETRKGISLITYHWEWHQHRFATMYCHVTGGEATFRTLRGFDAGEDDIEKKFLDPDEIAKIKEHAGELVKEAELKTTAYDERGRQYGSPKPRFFKKVGDGRWYITNYPQPF
jgi:tetrahydromethanopterin S-methyltransferase subunit G